MYKHSNFCFLTYMIKLVGLKHVFITYYQFQFQYNSNHLFGQTCTYNGLIQQKCIYRIEITNAYNVF